MYYSCHSRIIPTHYNCHLVQKNLNMHFSTEEFIYAPKYIYVVTKLPETEMNTEGQSKLHSVQFHCNRYFIKYLFNWLQFDKFYILEQVEQ